MSVLDSTANNAERDDVTMTMSVKTYRTRLLNAWDEGGEYHHVQGFESGVAYERERIVALLEPIAGKCSLCDYDAAEVIALIKGGDK
jgi:hypothetical protein